MATPLGHSLSGIIIYKIFFCNQKKTQEIKTQSNLNWLALIAIILIANLPDFDFIPGIFAGSLNKHHHGLIHSFGFVLIVTPILTFLFFKIFKKSFTKSFFIIFLTLTAHLLMDYLTLDLSLPYGAKIFWPFSQKFYSSKFFIFWPFWRDSWNDILSLKNFFSLLIEAIIMGMILFFVIKIKKTCKKPDF